MVAENKIRIPDPKRYVLRIRLSGLELARARQLAKLLTRGNLSLLTRYALKKLYEEKKNVLQ